MRISGCVLTTAVLVLALCGTSWADKRDDEARAQFKQGLALYNEHKFDQAAIAFGRAYELKPTYKLLYNIGQVENELSHYAVALEAYTRYITEGGKDVPKERRKQVRSEIKRLNALVGMIVIQGSEDGATILVDKEVRGKTPHLGVIFVDLGKHEVVVELKNKRLLDRVVKVAGGEKVVLEVGRDGAPPVEVKAEVEESEPSPPEEEETPDEEPSGRRLWTWVALGVGVGAGIGAGVTGGMAVSREGSLEENCPNQICPPAEEGDLDSTKKLALASTILTGVAAAGVVAGVVLFFVEPGMGEKEDTPVALLPSVTPNGGFLQILGRF
jgi:hypothetical protein